MDTSIYSPLLPIIVSHVIIYLILLLILQAFSHTYKANQVVVSAIFTMDSRKLITVGGRDSCVVQWGVV